MMNDFCSLRKIISGARLNKSVKFASLSDYVSDMTLYIDLLAYTPGAITSLLAVLSKRAEQLTDRFIYP